MQLKVLAVDDERVTLEVFKSVVGALGYDVVALSDSREAAQRIMTEKFDLIATDVIMPGLDGFELTERIRTSPPNQSVPILMFTASDSGETMRKGYLAGVTFYMAKPLSVKNLRGLFAAARGTMVKERRRTIRLPYRVEVICQTGGRRFKTRTIDLSQGGILLESLGGMEEGTIVEMDLPLPGASEPLKLMARATRKVSSQGTPLEFIDPEPQVRAELERFVVGKTRE